MAESLKAFGERLKVLAEHQWGGMKVLDISHADRDRLVALLERLVPFRDKMGDRFKSHGQPPWVYDLIVDLNAALDRGAEK